MLVNWSVAFAHCEVTDTTAAHYVSLFPVIVLWLKDWLSDDMLGHRLASAGHRRQPGLCRMSGLFEFCCAGFGQLRKGFSEEAVNGVQGVNLKPLHSRPP